MFAIRSLYLVPITVVLLTLSSPGYDFWFLAYIAYVPLFVLIDEESRWHEAALAGIATAFIYYIVNLHWVADTVTLYGDFLVIVKLSVAGLLALGLSLYMGAFAALYRRYNTPLMAACIFTVIEILRGKLFSGFPWLNLSYTQYNASFPLQTVSIIGEFGLVFAMVLINLYVADFLKNGNSKSLLKGAAAALLIFILGFVAFATYEEGKEMANVRIIQPGYDQKDKWIKAKRPEIFAHVDSLLRKSEPEKYDLIVAPETTYPAFLQQYPDTLLFLKLLSENTPIIMGQIRYEFTEQDKNIYNSATLFEKRKITHYNKMHLVPFGETFPLKDFLGPVQRYFFGNAKDYTAGTEPMIFKSGKMKIAPLICYEGVFTYLLLERILNGANIVAIVTNDGWFSDSHGRNQHLAADVLRAVEFRRTIIRSSSSGISAFILPDGSLQSTLGIGETGYLDGKVPLKEGLTIFARFNYMPLIVIFIIVLANEIRNREKKIVA